MCYTAFIVRLRPWKRGMLFLLPSKQSRRDTFIRTYAKSVWQQHWDVTETGRHLHKIQRHVDDDGNKTGKIYSYIITFLKEMNEEIDVQ